MKSTIRKFGKAHAVLVPKSILARIGLKANDAVDVSVENGRIVLTRPGHDPRAGWADESKALAAAGEAGLVWPEFANAGDKRLKW